MFRQSTILLSVCAAFLTGTIWLVPCGQAREWVDSTGNSKVEAEFVRFEDDNVVLRRVEGQEIKVPIDRLSDPDKAYLHGLRDDGKTPTHAEAVAEVGGEVTGSGSDAFIEVIYKGRSIQIPIKEGNVDLGDSDWQFSLSPLAHSPAAEAKLAPATVALEGDSELEKGMLSSEAILFISANGLVVVGILVYFLIIVPYRRRKSLREALRILHKDQRPMFSRAEELLDHALLAGLRKKDIAQARFAMGYLRCILGKYEEAATVLSDLEKSKAEIDRPAAYTMLWVQSRLKNHERVERIHAEYGGILEGYQQTALIASISYLALASLRLARREIHGALHYFDRVRELGVLADEIPGHLDDHEVVTGIVALFEKNRDEATKHFEAAIETAKERNKPTYTGRLGLLLCKWRDRDLSGIDQQLGEVLNDMRPDEAQGDTSAFNTKCPHCGKGYGVTSRYLKKKVRCNSCRRTFLVEPDEDVELKDEGTESEDRLLSEEDRLQRNVRLWHCMSRVAMWLSREERSGLPESEREVLRKRLQLVTQLDPDMGDPYLIDGLITYYFANSDEERSRAHKLIEKAVEREVHVPEVLQLLDRVNKLANLSEQSLAYFHQMSGKYAENAEVDPELRKRFVLSMNRFARFKDLGPIEELSEADSVAPSLENLQGRGQILQTRVSNIVRYRISDEESDVKEEIMNKLGELHERTQVLAEGTKAFQQTEFGLMESTGEFLFHDAEPRESETDSPDVESQEEAATSPDGNGSQAETS